MEVGRRRGGVKVEVGRRRGGVKVEVGRGREGVKVEEGRREGVKVEVGRGREVGVKNGAPPSRHSFSSGINSSNSISSSAEKMSAVLSVFLFPFSAKLFALNRRKEEQEDRRRYIRNSSPHPVKTPVTTSRCIITDILEYVQMHYAYHYTV